MPLQCTFRGPNVVLHVSSLRSCMMLLTWQTGFQLNIIGWHRYESEVSGLFQCVFKQQLNLHGRPPDVRWRVSFG